MDSQTFVQELETSNQAQLAKLRDAGLPEGEAPQADLKQLLQIALANEINVSELAAAWMPSTPEMDVKIALARQAGDEADHFRLVEGRLEALGFSANGFERPPKNPLFTYLQGLSTTVERVAAGLFTLESIAYQVNERFMEYCAQWGDHDTVALYQKRIQPDELHHHRLGGTLLEKYAVTPEAQQGARQAAARTLEMALELRLLTSQRLGTVCFPGC